MKDADIWGDVGVKIQNPKRPQPPWNVSHHRLLPNNLETNLDFCPNF